jgi:hypothetical protein
MKVHVVLRHPPSPFNHKLHLAAGEVMAVYADQLDANADAERRSEKPGCYIFSVCTKVLKTPAKD